MTRVSGHGFRAEQRDTGVLGLHFPCPAQFFVQSGPKVENGEERVQWPSCTGVSSCWLVILIGAGSSEHVGAQSPGAEVGIAFVCIS